VSEGGAVDGKTDVLKVVRRKRCRFKPGEAIQAGDLTQSVDGHERHDAAQRRISVGIPDPPVQGLGVQMRTGMICADQGVAAGEQLAILGSAAASV
jgi:hypothetical protein